MSNVELTEEERIAIMWQYRSLGGFDTALMDAISNADEDNLAKLELGFPDYVSLYRKYTRESGWWEMVKNKAISIGINF